MTRPLASAPRSVEGFVAFKGSDETVQVRFELAPDISRRLFSASRSLSNMDAANPSEVAKTLVELESLGFSSRAQTVERTGTTRHGTSVLNRAVADIHIEEARSAYARDDGKAALAAISLARARVKAGPKDWDILETDLHEAAGLRAIDQNNYKVARSEFLKAIRLDSGRQTRLASSIAIAIEAMDRKTAREQRVTQSVSQPMAGSVPAARAAPQGNTTSNLVQQCQTREAALQACRLMPGFGKDICKSSVRAKYSSISCP